MRERFLSDREYKNYFVNLGGVRRIIASGLPLRDGMKVLDIATGYGYFAFEVARRNSNIQVIGVDISQSDISKAREESRKHRLNERISFLQMDATNLDFPDESFDLAVNFLGLEDIHMTRGLSGVAKAIREAGRVLKAGKFFTLTVVPSDETETIAQQLDTELFSFVCNARWFVYRKYLELLTDAGFDTAAKKSYYTKKRLKPGQAVEEIKFACYNVPRIYGIRTRSFEETWEKYGTYIEREGLGHYSKVVSITAVKRNVA